jgi:hypothetical protein
MARSARPVLSSAVSLSLLLFCAAQDPASAQKPIERNYRFAVSGLDDRDDEKVVISVLRELVPEAVVSIGLGVQEVKVRCTTTLSPADVAAGLAPWGIELVRWNIISEAGLDQRAPLDGLPPDFPRLVPTGDPAADDADLRARKERWYADHPDHPLSPR